jgi:subfamily B ATP-binding cassette protein MsbA
LTYFSKISGNYIGLTDVFGYSRESDRFLRELNGSVASTISPSQNPHAMGMAHGPVEFKNVHFKYPIEGSKPKKVLNGASLYVKPGSKVAIYGKSGSGKSTLIKLLLGFYGPDAGSITMSGIDIKTIPVDELRKNISVVNQNIKLFDKTILENMTYGVGTGDETVTENDIKKIIGNMGVFEGVVDGLDTRVGVSGSKLSGGQKQIVNFVRAILKNAPILVLDEPTSALDTNTKKLVLDIIKKLKGKTVIIITHDKSIIPYVDKVYELIGGKLKMT